MNFNAENKVHGAVVREILLFLCEKMPQLRFKLRPGFDSRSAYVLEVAAEKTEHIIKLGLFIKTSSARRQPWKFSFTDMHQFEMSELKKYTDEVFVLFASGEDGVAGINYLILKEILDEEYEEMEWVVVRRKHNQSYRLSGSNGEFSGPIKKNAFLTSIMECVENKLLTV
jgi:hypothetical protein